jgi:hypothetical protein
VKRLAVALGAAAWLASRYGSPVPLQLGAALAAVAATAAVVDRIWEWTGGAS